MFLSIWKRLGALGTVVVALEALNNWFDYVLSPFLIAFFGPMRGGAVFFVTAFLANYLIVLWYKRTTSDWFGLEWLRLQESASSATHIGKVLRYALRRARPLAYIAVCIYDPAYGFIYARGRRGGSRFSKTDWLWFVASNLIGILVWIGLVSVGIELIKRVIFG